MVLPETVHKASNDQSGHNNMKILFNDVQQCEDIELEALIHQSSSPVLPDCHRSDHADFCQQMRGFWRAACGHGPMRRRGGMGDLHFWKEKEQVKWDWLLSATRHFKSHGADCMSAVTKALTWCFDTVGQIVIKAWKHYSSLNIYSNTAVPNASLAK